MTTLTEQQLQQLSQRYLQCLAAADWPAALSVARQALAAMPGHPQILGDVALCLMRLGQYDESLLAYRQALQGAPNEANLYDGLTELYGLRVALMQREPAATEPQRAACDAEREQIRLNGIRALALKDAACSAPVMWELPSCRDTASGHCERSEAIQPPALSADRHRNVIAYSLFGNNPRYCETALLNVQAAHDLFAQWTVRIYCDGSVPSTVRERLQHAGAELVLCEGEAWQGIHPLMWRFVVMEDPAVARWLIRDADSLLSTREQAAVQAWLASGLWFHMMRDYYTHTELLLAGLLGGCGGVFTELRSQMRAFAVTHAHEQRVVDQHFLRKCVWPTVRQSLLTHDSWFGFMDAQPFPAHGEHGLGESFHVGCNLASAAIGNDGSPLPDGACMHWQLVDEHGRLVCAYTAVVQRGAWRASLPMPYVRKLQAGLWRVSSSPHAILQSASSS